MTADDLHDLAIRTRDAARLAERHGTSVHGYRRAAREACERMGEMAAQLAEALHSREAIAEDRLSRHLADQRRIDGRDETIDALTRERDAALDAERCEHSLRLRWERRTDEARAELRALVASLGLDDGPRAAAIRHARAVLEGWGM